MSRYRDNLKEPIRPHPKHEEMSRAIILANLVSLIQKPIWLDVKVAAKDYGYLQAEMFIL